MRKVTEVKYLLPIGLSCAALLAGCRSPERETSTTYYQSSYSQDSGVRSTSTEYAVQEQGATGSQTQEIQSERMVIPLHEEQLQVGKRTVESGTVRLRKQIITETVNQPVQIRRETIVVDREPASGTTTTTESFQSSARPGEQFQGSPSQSQTQIRGQGGSWGQAFEQGEIVVRLHSEEPVIEKRIVPAGNIVVETRANTEQVNVQQQVRREKVDVEKSGNTQNVIISDRLQQQTTSTSPRYQETQRYQEQSTTVTPRTRTTETELEYRAPVTTREYEPFPRPQPDGRETFPELKKDPERHPDRR